MSFSKDAILSMYPNKRYLVKNSNGGLLGGFDSRDDAIDCAKRNELDYLNDKLNSNIKVFVYDTKDNKKVIYKTREVETENMEKITEYYQLPDDEHIIWDTEIDMDAYKDDIKENEYQEYVDEFNAGEYGDELVDFETWFERFSQDNYEEYAYRIGEETLEDLESNILPNIDTQLEDDVILIAGRYNSNYGDFRPSGDGSVYLNGIDGLQNYMGGFDRVCITTVGGNLGIILADHDGTVAGTLYTIPTGKAKIEMLKAMGYEEKVSEAYDVEDIEDQGLDELMEMEFEEDLAYGGVDEEEFGKVIDKLVPVKDTISGYGKETKKVQEGNTEKYWDATEIKRDLAFALLKFNFGYDMEHNNYIITLDGYDVHRFRATNNDEAIKIYDEFKKEWHKNDHARLDMPIEKVVEKKLNKKTKRIKDIKTESINGEEQNNFLASLDNCETVGDIQDLIYSISDGVLENTVQEIFDSCLQDEDDLDTIKSLVDEVFQDNAEIDNMEESTKEELNEAYWCGVPDVEHLWHGAWADPEVAYRGLRYNEWDLQDALWETYKEECMDNGIEVNEEDTSAFEKWCRDNADEVIGAFNYLNPVGVTDDVIEMINDSYDYDSLKGALESLPTETDIPSEITNQLLQRFDSLNFEKDNYEDETERVEEIIPELIEMLEEFYK